MKRCLGLLAGGKQVPTCSRFRALCAGMASGTIHLLHPAISRTPCFAEHVILAVSLLTGCCRRGQDSVAAMHSCIHLHKRHTTQLCIILPRLLVEWPRYLGEVVIGCPVPLLALQSQSAIELQSETHSVPESQSVLELHSVLKSQSLLESQTETPELPTGNPC